VQSQISATNGPVTSLHQKEYLIAIERRISKKGTEKRNNALLFKTENIPHTSTPILSLGGGG